MIPPGPIHELPPGYAESQRLVVTEGRLLLWLNRLARAPIPPALVLMAWWNSMVVAARGPRPGGLFAGGGLVVDLLLVLVTMALVFIIHEAIHGVFIALTGHRPRFGAKLDKGVIYATADNALFRRGEFLIIALSPLVFITLGGMALMWPATDQIAYFIGLGVIINASGAAGDLWMTWLVLRSPSTALVRDMADGIIIYTRQEA